MRDDLQYWQQRLKDGAHNPRTGLHLEPTLFRANWLHNVAQVGQLRTVASERLYVGIEGPTAAGKSSLLTTLAATPLAVFGAGAGTGSRAMDL